MHLLEITPSPCNVCGRGNVQDQRDPVRFVDFERDINWNDPLIICEDCIAKAGGLVGMLTADAVLEADQKVKRKDEEIHELKAEIDNMRRKATRLGMTFEKAVA